MHEIQWVISLICKQRVNINTTLPFNIQLKFDSLNYNRGKNFRIDFSSTNAPISISYQLIGIYRP